ncbi:MAG: LCP family protein [Endomicrobia bacterium]|nr:LCP family protein [Endomicrobiia bacterium]
MKIKHVVLILCCGVILYIAYLSYRSVFISNNAFQKRTNFIILGTDFVDNSIHADTIIFLSYLPSEKVLDIISIPRDTYINVEGVKYKKITELYAFFYMVTKDRYQAAKEFIKVLENNLFSFGDKKISISYFFVIDYRSFIKFINAIGKIKIIVDKPMHYDDYAGKLHIHFEPGVYYMNGEEALKYVRFRDATGDMGRILRQQQFIKGVINRIFSIDVIYKFPKLVYMLQKCFLTNMNLLEIFNLFLEFKNLKFTNLRFSTLETLPKGRYLEVNKDALEQLFGYFLDNKVRKKDEKKERVIVKVYNASNKPKLAKQVSLFLREKGYDVLDWGNWYCKLPKSKIIDYSNDIKSLNEICNLLNIFDINIYNKEYLEEYIDFAIILGEDFVLSQ